MRGNAVVIRVSRLVWMPTALPSCSITLFQIMFDLVKDLGASPTTGHETGMQLVKILVEILKLGGGTFLYLSFNRILDVMVYSWHWWMGRRLRSPSAGPT